MITRIGIVAGEIWHYLEGHGDTSLETLIKGVDKPRDVILMSLGWLAREGHIILEDAPNYNVSLREKEELEEV